MAKRSRTREQIVAEIEAAKEKHNELKAQVRDALVELDWLILERGKWDKDHG